MKIKEKESKDCVILLELLRIGAGGAFITGRAQYTE